VSRVLIIAEHADGKLNAGTARCVACAAALPEAQIDIAVLAAEGGAVAAEAATLAGVARVLRCDHPALAHPLATALAPVIAALAADYTHVLAPSTTFGKDVLPRAAALLGVPQLSDVMAVDSATRFRRPIYAGNAVVTVEVQAGMTVLATVRTASFAPAASGRAAGEGAAVIEARAVQAEIPAHTRFVSVSKATSHRPELQSAQRVVSGGRGVGSAENFQLIYRLADRLGAAVGASRAAVDAGYVPNDLQVGQTGKIIAPELYVAVGISGAIQHLTGIKDAGTIVAINRDADAPIFEIADYGLVGDLFQILPELERLLG
jgi:electron transfer flavoprotein alpha subunit